MRFFIDEKEIIVNEYQNGKIVDGKFYESIRDLEKYGGGDPISFFEKWDNAEEAINLITTYMKPLG